MTIAEWSKVSGIRADTLVRRVRKGEMTVGEILTTLPNRQPERLKKYYRPSPEVIKSECEIIQNEWDEDDRDRRLGFTNEWLRRVREPRRCRVRLKPLAQPKYKWIDDNT